MNLTKDLKAALTAQVIAALRKPATLFYHNRKGVLRARLQPVKAPFVSNANSFEREAPNLKQTAAEAVPLLLESLEVFPQGAHTGAGVTEV